MITLSSRSGSLSSLMTFVNFISLHILQVAMIFLQRFDIPKFALTLSSNLLYSGVGGYCDTILVSQDEVLLGAGFCVVHPPPFSSKVSSVRNLSSCIFVSFFGLYGISLVPCHLFDVVRSCHSRLVLTFCYCVLRVLIPRIFQC